MIARALAVWRLTELVVDDEITRPAREWVTRRWPGSHVAYLVSCKRCVSVWAAAAVLTFPEWLTRILALSSATILTEEVRDHVQAWVFNRKVTAGGVGTGETATVQRG